MPLPKLGHTFNQERAGVLAVEAYAMDKHVVFRETPLADVGIDAQLEYLTPEGHATGKLIAVQIKSGPSFFTHANEAGWTFYPEDKHRDYWERFALPVLLVLHDPDARESYWVDVRHALRAVQGTKGIQVPRSNALSTTVVTDLFANAGVLDQPFIESMPALLHALVSTRSDNTSFPLSYLELFVRGLTNLARSIYYGMDAILLAVDENLALDPVSDSMGVGPAEHDFAFGFVQFLVGQNLAHVDYGDCLIDWVSREMQPHFVAPLTSRGRELVAFISDEEQRLTASGLLPESGVRVAQEAFFQMEPMSYGARGPRIQAFRETWKKQG